MQDRMIELPEAYFDGQWEKANIPIKLRGLRLSDYDTGDLHFTRMNALRGAQDFVENFKDHYLSPTRIAKRDFPEDRSLIGKGLLFFGRNGTGKTTLAAATLTDLQYKYPKLDVYYIRFSSWKKALTDTFNKDFPEIVAEAQHILHKANTARALVLDDIGQEHRTDSQFTEKEFHEFLRRRHESALPTIVTSNQDEAMLQTVWGQSFDSFRHDAFDNYPMLGKDLRKVNAGV